MLFVLIGLVGTLMVLTEMGINVTPLLAGAGVIGLAIGFGAQTLVKDVITGLFILFESTVDVGDWVDLGGLQGEVERMTVRSIRLRDLHGTVHVIPFSEVTSVSNYTRDYAYALVDVPIAYQEDVDRLVDLMEQVAQHLREDPEVGRQILAPLEVFGLDRFEESAVIVRARLLTRPGQQWHVRRVYQAAIKRACEEAGIELALPHMKLYFGESRLGPTPPARVRQEGGDHHSGQAALPQGSRPASTGSDLVPSFTSSPGDSE
jgi:small conductance mechanosensitive channel